jgi:hypothetical protein
MKRWKRIMAMSYGTPEQMEAADEWMERFQAIRREIMRRDDELAGYPDWLACAIRPVWERVTRSDVGCLAARRLHWRNQERAA